MKDVMEGMEGVDVVSGYGLKTNEALAVEKAIVATGSGGVVIINLGVSRSTGVLLAADEVCCSISVGLEGVR